MFSCEIYIFSLFFRQDGHGVQFVLYLFSFYKISFLLNKTNQQHDDAYSITIATAVDRAAIDDTLRRRKNTSDSITCKMTAWTMREICVQCEQRLNSGPKLFFLSLYF